MTVPSKSLIAMARASRVARSRWLVGSSSSSRLGRCQTIMASTRRAFSPPLMLPTACLTMSAEVERAQVAAQVLLAGLRAGGAGVPCQADHVLHGVFAGTQHIQFLLGEVADVQALAFGHGDRKSTRLNSSHQIISYAVFCLKKKTTYTHATTTS